MNLKTGEAILGHKHILQQNRNFYKIYYIDFNKYYELK